MKSVTIGLLGLGTVGTGVAEHIQKVGQEFGLHLKSIAVATEKVILCGETETPPSIRIKRASENTVKEAIKDLQKSKRVRGKPVFIRFEE